MVLKWIFGLETILIVFCLLLKSFVRYTWLLMTLKFGVHIDPTALSQFNCCRQEVSQIIWKQSAAQTSLRRNTVFQIHHVYTRLLIHIIWLYYCIIFPRYLQFSVEPYAYPRYAAPRGVPRLPPRLAPTDWINRLIEVRSVNQCVDYGVRSSRAAQRLR